MTQPVDLGAFFCLTLLDNVKTAIDNAGLQQPAVAEYTTGSTISIADCCDGLLWTRVDTVYPTDGSGNNFAQARIDFSVPAWAWNIQIGVLWCHQNLTELGDYIDPAVETQFAERDAAYQLAVFTAVTELFPAAAGHCALGYRFAPFTPYGPDGGCSGGMLMLTVISAALSG